LSLQKIKILIPIEISSREMLYKIYLCNILSSKGFECYLGSKSEINFLIEKFNDFIYLDKGYHKDNSDLIYKKIIKNRGVIVSLDEEGAVDFEDGSTLKVRYNEKLFKASRLVFFWGKYQTQIIKDLTKINSNCIISGHPRFELLKKDFHFLYDYDLNFIQKKYKKYILINTNMGFGNNIRGDEFILKNYIDRFKNIRKIINNDKIKLEYFISLINKLSELDYNIVVRPHPEEDFKIYKDSFNLKENIFITNDRSVVPWIIGCETMIHSDCTTGIESLMLGKESIAFVPSRLDRDFLTSLPLQASKVINSEVQVLNYIKKKKYNKNVNFSNYPWLKNNFNYPGKSFNIISNFLEKIELKTNYESIAFTEIVLKNIKNKIKFFLKGKDKLISEKAKDFNYVNVKRIHNKIVLSKSGFKKNNLRKIFDNLFIIKQ
jgi:surface carbohydrate biosynthesis protein